MLRYLIAITMFALAMPASAQTYRPGNPATDANPMPVKRPGSTSTSTAGTIAAANTYQSVMATNSERKGCTIQNKSVNVIRVFLGAPGLATDATSLDLAAGATFSCTSHGGMVVLDQISLSSPVAASAYLLVLQ